MKRTLKEKLNDWSMAFIGLLTLLCIFAMVGLNLDDVEGFDDV